MSADARRKIAQLRALAASTTFPAEAESARAKADQLEAELPKESPWIEGQRLAGQSITADMLYEQIKRAQAEAYRSAGIHPEQHHAHDAFNYMAGAANPYFQSAAEIRMRQQEFDRAMRERWQRMFDEAMGRRR